MNNKFIEALGTLNSDQKPVWGKMTSQHMVEHLILAVKMGNGKLKLECINPPDKLPTLKKFLMSNRPMPKGFVNSAIGPNNLPLHYSSLDEAINTLKEEIEDYFHFFEENPSAKPVNVTFGKLNKAGWDQFHKKHFTHHMEQFGLLQQLS
jgi:hypothetical protein